MALEGGRVLRSTGWRVGKRHAAVAAQWTRPACSALWLTPTVLCLTERVRVGSLKLGQTTSVVVQMVGLVVGMVAERLEVVGRSTSGSELRTFQASCLVYVRIVDPLLGAMESTGTPTPSEPPKDPVIPVSRRAPRESF